MDCGLRVFDITSRPPAAGRPPRFAVVIPCFNEQQALMETLATLRHHLRNTGPYELIVVNDGSTDRTAELLAAAVRQDPDLKVLTHPRNRGYGAALKTAIAATSAELIVITDADGTYPQERIVDLLVLAQHVDMVVGARTAPDAKYPLIRKLPKAFLRRYGSWIVGTPIPDLNSGLRVFPRQLAQHFFYLLPDGFSFTTTITLALLSHGRSVHFEPIRYATRIGKSKIQPIRDTLRFLHLIVRMGLLFAPMRTLMPLSLALGGLCSLSLGFDLLVARNLTDKTVLLLMFSMNTALFALLADVIHLISRRSVAEQPSHQDGERWVRADRAVARQAETDPSAAEVPHKQAAA
ncbi:MAG: hypothetical protein A2W31_07405 [Planctomycetes bacterium RBG_16_64_10]|nr:MAG: hypothetical protein A2W31_07405 [Planctomycetes bacterium RBG_16_64_10]